MDIRKRHPGVQAYMFSPAFAYQAHRIYDRLQVEAAAPPPARLPYGNEGRGPAAASGGGSLSFPPSHLRPSRRI